MKQTKIICTLGPAVDSLDKIRELIFSGMNIARFNFSHGSKKEHEKRINWVKKAREELGVACALMLDTKGPEVRIGTFPEGKITFSANQKFTVLENAKNPDEIPIDPVCVLESIEPGMRLLFNDGYICSKVIEKKGSRIVVQMENAGTLASHKGINVPDANLHLPALTQRDIEDVIFGCAMGMDIIAASFIRSSEHVLAIKQLLAKEKSSHILVIAKIENRQGIENLDYIVQVSDGIMVARGDLGVEMDPSIVPLLQKMMVRKCFAAHKPVTIATQMLESMIQNPRATRAEASDVANAIYEGADSTMLSGESAVGRYPIEAVVFMRKIALASEKDLHNHAFYLHSRKTSRYLPSDIRKDFPNVSSEVAFAAVETASTLKAKAIFVFTTSGLTARLISRFKPQMPVVCVTSNPKIFHQLSYLWGVFPRFCSSATFSDSFAVASSYALEQKWTCFGDLVVVVAGSEFGLKGSTNTMIVETIGDILLRAEQGYGNRVQGSIKLFLSEKSQENLEDAIIVLPKCTQSYLSIMRKAKGVILDNHPEDQLSVKSAIDIAKMYNLSLIVQAENALSILQQQETVVMDPSKAIIYRQQKKKE